MLRVFFADWADTGVQKTQAVRKIERIAIDERFMGEAPFGAEECAVTFAGECGASDRQLSLQSP
jgi:hypothetical protein